MLGRTFKCSVCAATFHAGITNMYKTDILPDAIFYDTGDERGMWVTKDEEVYCGECSDKTFPEITDKDVKFVRGNTICY